MSCIFAIIIIYVSVHWPYTCSIGECNQGTQEQSRHFGGGK